ncbi:hypothetical protein Lfu02_41650 [Longispora fulva]|uniref:KAP NTPase domain-containing protein n=1 Tax=Longispora fulva TaxID=619741 RepID=A0A8J7KJ76_9ACTN|nr:P-loop NTPase fold protein [Longispora fulva]MBG6136624.1 hypothetical protein [Longispora fulva]GIG59793.1 hypothetical protein Lfu02_41650 [Longispora fulva]
MTVDVTVANTTDVVDGFLITITAASGVTVTPASHQVNLYPGTEASVTFSVRPAVRSGPLQLTVVVATDFGKAVGRLSVATLADRPEPGAGFNLLSDHPVDENADAFGYAEVAARLAGILLNNRAVTPFTIGIQGGWGTGKSSLMQLLRAEVERRIAGERKRVRVAWFNAWTAEGSNALTALIRSVLHELDPNVLRRVLRRTSSASWLTAPFVVLANWLGLRRFADDLWQRFAVDATQRNEIRKELQKALREWANQDRMPAKRRSMVVFIDDLDRCSPENILQIFEAVRLYLDAPGLTFVIGYDPAVVAGVLARTKGATSGPIGRTYLEKIIQVDFPVPMPDQEQARRLAADCARQAGVNSLLDDNELALIMDRSDWNPRRFKRFLNTFVLSHQLDGSAALLQPGEQMKMLLLRMYFPDFFRLMMTEPERDVLRQLITLYRFRSAVTAGRDVDPQEVPWLFEAAEVAPRGEDEAWLTALARLEENLPEVIIELSRNSELYAMAWSLGTDDQRVDLLRRTRERLPLRTAWTREPPAPEPTWTAQAPALEPVRSGVRPALESAWTGKHLPCPHCGNSNPEDTLFCGSCGAFLDPGPESHRSAER